MHVSLIRRRTTLLPRLLFFRFSFRLTGMLWRRRVPAPPFVLVASLTRHLSSVAFLLDSVRSSPLFPFDSLILTYCLRCVNKNLARSFFDATPSPRSYSIALAAASPTGQPKVFSNILLVLTPGFQTSAWSTRFYILQLTPPGSPNLPFLLPP